jgi:hypothetical protein
MKIGKDGEGIGHGLIPSRLRGETEETHDLDTHLANQEILSLHLTHRSITGCSPKPDQATPHS